MRRGPEGYLKRWQTDAPPFDTEWEQTHVLRFERAGRAPQHRDLLGRRSGSSELVRQPADADRDPRTAGSTRPTRRSTYVVSPDGEWRWKDEDELEEAVELGIWTQAEADEIRAEGERVIAGAPVADRLGGLAAAGGWGPLGLPRDWHVV